MISVLTISMEAELGALFVNLHLGTLTCMVLIEMGHYQLPTPAVMYSAIGDGFFNENISQQC